MATPVNAWTVLRVIRSVAGTDDTPAKLGWDYGCRAYDGTAVLTPKQWAAKGYDSRGAIAFVVHEDSTLGRYFCLDHCYVTGQASDYDTFEKMSDALGEEDMWAECLNTWSTAIYRH